MSLVGSECLIFAFFADDKNKLIENLTRMKKLAFYEF